MREEELVADEDIDWSLCTFEGSRRRQHQDYRALPFRAKLEALEEMARLALLLTASRRARGLPVHTASGKNLDEVL